MADRKFFGTTELVEEFVARLVTVGSVGGWTTEYMDPETEQLWLKYTTDERGFSENLMVMSPPLTTPQLVDLVFTSPYLDEVSAAATRLHLEEEADKKDFRALLMDRLNQIDILDLDQATKDRVKIIIIRSKLTDRVNKRNIIGNHFSEIQKDGAFFNAMGQRAQEILNML